MASIDFLLFSSSFLFIYFFFEALELHYFQRLLPRRSLKKELGVGAFQALA